MDVLDVITSSPSDDPAWGLRSVEDVAGAARAAGLDLIETVEMPANNLSLVLRRQGR